MYKIVYTNRMKKDAKLMKKRGKDMQKLVNMLSMLANGILYLSSIKTTL